MSTKITEFPRIHSPIECGELILRRKRLFGIISRPPVIVNTEIIWDINSVKIGFDIHSETLHKADIQDTVSLLTALRSRNEKWILGIYNFYNSFSRKSNFIASYSLEIDIETFREMMRDSKDLFVTTENVKLRIFASKLCEIIAKARHKK